jgi:dihydroxy-acid dehydratase
VEHGDKIIIDIPARSITLDVADEVLATRRAQIEVTGFKPQKSRPRKVSAALKAYAMLATSADKGAVRDLSKLD